MAKTCFPLDNTNYLAKDLRLWHIGRTNGLINYTGNDFSVTPDEGMNVTLGPGYMYMFTGTKDPGGIIFGETEEQQLSGYVADAYVRYDYICIEYDAELNDAVPKFVKGTRDMPTPVRNETVYQNIVAVIRVKANASKIDQEDIIDTRMKEEYCGLAVDMLSKIPTDEYYNQFMAFMKTIEGTLGEDAAGNLLLQINQIKQDYVPKSDIVNDVTSGGTNKPLSAEQGKVLNNKLIPSTVKVVSGNLTLLFVKRNDRVTCKFYNIGSYPKNQTTVFLDAIPLGFIPPTNQYTTVAAVTGTVINSVTRYQLDGQTEDYPGRIVMIAGETGMHEHVGTFTYDLEEVK